MELGLQMYVVIIFPMSLRAAHFSPQVVRLGRDAFLPQYVVAYILICFLINDTNLFSDPLLRLSADASQ
jgi:hypothetical protein